MFAQARPIAIRPFAAGDEFAFRTLNEAWIERHFGVEAKDRVTLGDPVGQVLRPGGHIFMAVVSGATIGCCALMAKTEGVFELAKMAVDERWQGRGIGRRLIEHAVAEARARGARALYLETNHTLVN